MENFFLISNKDIYIQEHLHKVERKNTDKENSEERKKKGKDTKYKGES